MDKTFSPFVVVGSSKSGTTWLQKLLDLHPQIRCHFQVPLFPLCDGDLFYPARVTLKVPDTPYAGVFSHPEEEARYQAVLRYVKGLEVMTAAFQQRIRRGLAPMPLAATERLHRSVRAAIAKTLLCDTREKPISGTKAYTDIESLFDVFPRAKVIHILRDGRDVCVSKRFHTMRKGLRYSGDEKSRLFYRLNRQPAAFRIIAFLRRKFGWFGESWFHRPGEDIPLLTKESLTKFATEWRNIVRYNLYAGERYQGRFLTIKYEALLTDGQRTVCRVLDFLGADCSTIIADRLLEETRFDRLTEKEGNSFFRKGKTGDWKNHFRTVDARRFHRLAGDLLIQLGYEPDAQWVNRA